MQIEDQTKSILPVYVCQQRDWQELNTNLFFKRHAMVVYEAGGRSERQEA